MSAPAVFALPARLDLTSAAALAEELRGRLGADLALDAGSVTHLGTPGLQVLLAARASWAAAGRALRVENAPDSLAEQLAQFGLSLSDLAADGASAGDAPDAPGGDGEATEEAET